MELYRKNGGLQMVNRNKLAIDIREVFLQHYRNLNINHNEELIKDLLAGLESLLPGISFTFLHFNAWEGVYQSIGTDCREPSFDIQEIINHSFENTTRDTCSNSYAINEVKDELYLIKYDLALVKRPYYLVIRDHQNILDYSSLEFTCKEFGQFLEMYSYNRYMGKKMENSKIRNKLSEKIFSTGSRRRALTHFVHYFEEAYPELEYKILLSQDYEKVCDLPVGELNFDYEGNRVIDQAFLTGEIKTKLSKNQLKIYIPLRGSQGIYGVLVIISENTRQIPEEEIDSLLKFANICGQALENVSLYQHSISLVSDLKLINDATKSLNTNTDINELTSLVINQIKEASSAEEIGVLLFEEDELGSEEFSRESTAFFKENNNENFVSYLKTSCINNSRIFSGKFSNIFKDTPFESIMALPMIHTDQHLGLIIIMHRERYFFSFESFKLVQSLVQHYTLTISNAILKNKLEQAVITDYLTGLYARNYLDDQTKEHMKSKESGVLVLFDIDDFKEINDTYGHSVGDQVIIQIAKILKDNVSSRDIAARWGGEELALYLPNRSLKESYELAKKILSTVERETNPRVTLSSGISSWRPGFNDSVKELFICTDQALYKAKSAGKNQIIVADCSVKV